MVKIPRFDGRRTGCGLLVLGLIVLFRWLVPVPALAQTPGIVHNETGDRSVIVEWSKAAGDSLTPEERVEIPRILFLVPDFLQIDPNHFSLADMMVGRGGMTSTLAGDLQIVVGNPGDLFKKGEEELPSYPVDFQVTGAFPFGRNYVGVAFSQPVNEEQATQIGNYGFSPPLDIQSARLQANGQTVILAAGSDLPLSTGYTVTVSGVTSRDGGQDLEVASAEFQTLSTAVTNIDTVQADPSAFSHDSVTVVGEVYIPVSSATDSASGYIEDGSGHGIHLWGGDIQSAVSTVGNVVSVTGMVQREAFTLQLVNYTAVLLARDQPRLAPRVVDIRKVQSRELRGTYVQTEAALSRKVQDAGTGTEFYEVSRSDTLFAGYRVWRAMVDTTAHFTMPPRSDFALLRTYSLLDSTWTFSVDGPRIFADPDSIIPRGTEHDRLRDPNEPVPGPINGFGYVYSVTWFDAYLDPTTNPPEAIIFDRAAPQEGAYQEVILPGPKARVETPLLGDVKVVPNPYNRSAAYASQAFPGPPRVQFINLPEHAMVDVYTASGDLVRSLSHDEDTDYMDWDLKNNDGKDIAPGIYIFYVKASKETRIGRFVVIR